MRVPAAFVLSAVAVGLLPVAVLDATLPDVRVETVEGFNAAVPPTSTTPPALAGRVGLDQAGQLGRTPAGPEPVYVLLDESGSRGQGNWTPNTVSARPQAAPLAPPATAVPPTTAVQPVPTTSETPIITTTSSAPTTSTTLPPPTTTTQEKGRGKGKGNGHGEKKPETSQGRDMMEEEPPPEERSSDTDELADSGRSGPARGDQLVTEDVPALP